MDIEILDEVVNDDVVSEADLDFDIITRDDLEKTKEIDVSAINEELEKTMSIIIGDENE